MDFNYEIINKKFENDNVWVVIFKFSTLIILKTMVEFDPIQIWKFFIAKQQIWANFKFSNKIIIPKHDITLKILK